MIPFIIPILATLGITGAAAWAIKKFFFNDNKEDKNKTKVLLLGDVGAGKTTILGTIEGKSVSELSKNNPTNVEDEYEINNFKFLDCSGAAGEAFKEVVEKIIDYLDSCDVLLYIFDATKYDDKNNKLNINYYYKKANEKDLKLITIGTRGSKVEYQSVKQAIQSIGPNIKCEILELVDIDDSMLQENKQKILELLED